MEPFNLDRFWQHLSEVLRQLDRHHNTDNIGLAEQLLIRAEDCQSVLRAILGRISDVMPRGQLVEDIEVLLNVLSRHCDHILEWTLREDADHPRLVGATRPITREYCGRGRPPHEIRKEALEALLELGFNYRQVGTILGVSERTVRRRRIVFGLPVGPSSYSTISDGDLDFIINNVLQVSYNCVIIINLTYRTSNYRSPWILEYQ